MRVHPQIRQGTLSGVLVLLCRCRDLQGQGFDLLTPLVVQSSEGEASGRDNLLPCTALCQPVPAFITDRLHRRLPHQYRGGTPEVDQSLLHLQQEVMQDLPSTPYHLSPPLVCFPCRRIFRHLKAFQLLKMPALAVVKRVVVADLVTQPSTHGSWYPMVRLGTNVLRCLTRRRRHLADLLKAKFIYWIHALLPGNRCMTCT